METKRFFRNLLSIVIGNGVLLISQILVGLVLPIVLSIDGFGNYRIFMLYGTYASLLHFGFVDGILVKFGGKSYSDFRKEDVISLFIFFMIMEMIISIIIIVISLSFFDGKYRLIFISVGIYTFFLNMVTAFQYYSQAIMKFKLVASMSSIQAILNTINIAIPSLIIFGFHWIKSLNYNTYIYMYICTYLILLCVYVYSYFHNCSNLKISLSFNKSQIYEIFKIGFPITIASQIGNITLNLDNQFVSLFFPTQEFAKYAFSYNLISLTIAIVLAISTVLFPYLNRESKDSLIKNYSKSMAFMLIFIYSTLYSYYPIEFIVKFILPQYIGSLSFFRILLPGVAITTSISTIIFNHYKVTGDMKIYLTNGIYSLLISLVIYFLCYSIFHSSISLAFASIVALFIWFILEDYSFRAKYNVIRYKDYFYMFFCTITFQLSVKVMSTIVSILFYTLIYIILSYLFEKEYCILLYKKVKRTKDIE